MQRFGPCARGRRLVENRTLADFDRFADKTKSPAQKRFRIGKPTRGSIVGMEDDAIGHFALEQQRAINPCAPPECEERLHDLSHGGSNQLRRVRGAQLRSGCFDDRHQWRSAAILAAYEDGPPRNTEVPATRMVAPASIASWAVSGVMPPSTSRSIARPERAMRSATASIVVNLLSMNSWPPKPGLTVMTRTRSTRSSTLSMASIGVPGLRTMPGRLPQARISCSVR